MRTARQMLEAGFEHHRQGQWTEAEQFYDALLGYGDEPDANVLYAIGLLRLQQGSYGQAKDYLGRSVMLFPEHPAAWSNLGIALKRMGQDKAAEFAHERACEVSPDESTAWSNRSAMYINNATPERAEEYARKAVAIDPDDAEAHNHLGIALLEQGRYDEAWPHYAWRWQVQEKIKDQRPYKCPKWDGSYVKRLAIHGEQGIGDEIMFMGCLAKVRDMVGRIQIECTPRLVQWFEKSFRIPCYGNHNELIVTNGEPDAYISMGDLPGIVGMPDGKPYLIRPNLATSVPGRIGIAWKGGTNRTNKRERSLKLEDLRPILDLGLDFRSVQYDGAAEAKVAGLPNRIDDRDVDQIADEIARCELIITPCQAAVHMAGAMGVPAWVMTPKKCAWRYGGNGRAMSWYQSVRLFRQYNDETWSPVIAEIAAELPAALRITPGWRPNGGPDDAPGRLCHVG